jgi:uncharacterized protein (DUF58 family)
VEPGGSTLYRTFILVTIPFLVLLGAALAIPAYLALAGAWALFLAGSWLAARRGLRGLSVRRQLYPSAFEGDEVTVELVLEASRRAGMVEVVDAFGPSLAIEERLLEAGPLEPGLRRRLTYTSFCSRHWGVYTVGPVRLVAADPAGLFHAVRPVPLIEEFAVFPHVYDVSGLLPLGARASFTPHEETAGRPGQSPLYLGVRDYRPGDDLRHIHWPASARRGTLVVKEYEVDQAPYVTLFIDLDRRNRAGTGKKSTLEYVIRTAASVVWSAVRSGSFVQVVGEARRPVQVPPGRGETHLTYALYELLRAVPDGQAPLAEVVLHHLPQVPERSTAVVISGTLFVDLGGLDEVLEGFRGRSVRTAIVLVNNHSFPAIEGWPPSRAEILERKREVEFFLRSRGVPLRILEESDDLEAVLTRGGFSA